MKNQTPALGDLRCIQAFCTGSAVILASSHANGEDRTYVTATQVNLSDNVFSPIQSLDQLGLACQNQCWKNVPFTRTIPVIGIHSRDPSGWMVGLLRAGSASKCSCTRVAIRDGNVGLEESIFACKAMDVVGVESIKISFRKNHVISNFVLEPILIAKYRKYRPTTNDQQRILTSTSQLQATH